MDRRLERVTEYAEAPERERTTAAVESFIVKYYYANVKVAQASVAVASSGACRSCKIAVDHITTNDDGEKERQKTRGVHSRIVLAAYVSGRLLRLKLCDHSEKRWTDRLQ
jgi:hypothetical protein